MATKRQIAEQVLRIVNGGGIDDDAKVTLQEVGVLMEHERDALAKKAIMENATIGENEIPSEFISVRQYMLNNDTSGIYGVGGRAFADLYDAMPINLPNDGGIYRVCRAQAYTAYTDKYSINCPDVPSPTWTPFSAGFRMSNLSGTHDIGRKFVLSFKHGKSDLYLDDYQFQFEYFDFDTKLSDSTSYIAQYTIKPMWIVYSLLRNSEFVAFLEANELVLQPSDVADSNQFVFFSNNQTQTFGPTSGHEQNNFEIKSVLTNERVVSFSPGWNPFNATALVQPTTEVIPELLYGMTFYYPKNRRIYGMEADPLGVKAKDSYVLNCYINITWSEMNPTDGWGETENYDDTGDGVNNASYDGVRGVHLTKMWMNKFAGVLKHYGIVVSQGRGAAAITIEEDFPLGGIEHILHTTHLPGADGALSTITLNNVSTGASERANYSENLCYRRMPNPGLYSGMYDSAIVLSGEKYWYRQQGTWQTGGSRIYLYNEDWNFNLNHSKDMKQTDPAPGMISVWMIAKSGSLDWGDQFPLPADATSEMIASLVATFTAMRAAKEDLTNDNVDIT
tara:strand:- start:3312 stop:5000 length:1689 start_codon:yes stop_codon:yes gene_type:complete